MFVSNKKNTPIKNKQTYNIKPDIIQEPKPDKIQEPKPDIIEEPKPDKIQEPKPDKIHEPIYKPIYYKQTEQLLKKYELSFERNITSIEQTNINRMIYELYNTNNNFYELMNKYTTIHITKSIHNDRIKKFKHFTCYFYNNYTGNKSVNYHFYIQYDKICSITKIQNMI